MYSRAKQYKRLGPKSQHPLALRDRFTAWRNNPAFSKHDAHHDAQGFRRDQDVSVEKPAGTVRIFLLGGSAAYGLKGAYPEIDNRFWQIYNNQLIDYYLEQRLNSAFPSKHWEVINAATVGYQLHQQLALLESVLLRYHPDYVISMDGYNDLVTLYNDVRGGKTEPNLDVYAATPLGEEFNALANPQSPQSIAIFAATWLRNNSVFFRTLQDRLRWRVNRAQLERGRNDLRSVSTPAQFSELSPAEQAQFRAAQANIGYYPHLARQINAILKLDGVQPVFLLQPELILTRKPFPAIEKRLYDYDRKARTPLYVYMFEQLSPVIASGMSDAAAKDGFTFFDLQDVYDQTTEQTFSDFCHLTPKGNEVIAEYLFERLHDSFAEKARAAN